MTYVSGIILQTSHLKSVLLQKEMIYYIKET